MHVCRDPRLISLQASAPPTCSRSNIASVLLKQQHVQQQMQQVVAHRCSLDVL
jgi:hypothetical protein